MEQNIKILEGYSDMEKGAYLGAIASISTADRSASEEELSYLQALCQSAQLSKDQSDLIVNAAKTPIPEADLQRCLDVLKTSDLRFSLISDVIAFAQSDKSYSEEEKQAIHKIADYLGVNSEQLSALNQFAQKTMEEAPKLADAAQADTGGNFLDKLGLGNIGEKLKNSGINSSALLKGALGILGPIALAKMFSRRGSGAGGMGGGGLLGVLLGGGLLGGLLSGGRGFGGAGDMLGRMFGGTA